MKFLIGLGNPGEKYGDTRHNLGSMVLEQIAAELGLNWKNGPADRSLVAKHGDTFLAKPLTYMNESGLAVRALLDYYKILPKKLGLFTKKNSDLSPVLVIIHDDIDLPFGTFKISTGSRSAGHRGVQSVIDHLKTKEFRRYRLGIKPPFPLAGSAKSFVLGKFVGPEKETLKIFIPEISRIIMNDIL